MTDAESLREIGRLRARVRDLDRERAAAVDGLTSIASMTQSTNLLWWQNKARETLKAMGVDINGGKA